MPDPIRRSVDPYCEPQRQQNVRHANDASVSTVAVTTETKAPIARKYIFFSYEEKDETDSYAANGIIGALVERRMRVYQSRKDENINTSIANGIENAAVVLVFASPSLQQSKDGSKILNYADQRKPPILSIKHIPNFQPHGWLGAILAAHKTCSSDFNDVMNSLNSLGIRIEEVTLNDDETNDFLKDSEHLFRGSTQDGNMVAHYTHSNKIFPMKFEFFGLENGRIFGQGDDDVGPFTVAGQYKLNLGQGDIHFMKSYVGKHTIEYLGKISISGTKCILHGRWQYGGSSDEFSIDLTLKEVLDVPLPAKPSRTFATKVMLSYCPYQYELAEKITKGLNDKGIPAICPEFDLHGMIQTAAKHARVVVPLMSQAYENSNICKQFLTYVDEAAIPIVPLKAQYPYSQSGWLGVICAGALWTQMTKDNEFEQKLTELIGQLSVYTSGPVDESENETVADDSYAIGYYEQWGEKHDMKFDMFVMVSGCIAGQGSDEVGDFVIDGQYSCYGSGEDYQVQFKKHYIGQHDVNYCGTTTHADRCLTIEGEWSIEDSSDKFHIEVVRQRQSTPSGLHVMLSYQWNSQELVKRVANMLRQRNIPIWFDIAGDMKGNINTAMANGVEKAAIVLSFITIAYSKSVNCQKELTYASQLKKKVIPALVENDQALNGTWLSIIIASLNKINLQDKNEFDQSFDKLVHNIDAILDEQKKEETSNKKTHAVTRFEGGAVAGKYCQYGRANDMFFEYFSLRDGRVAGQGNDTVGQFTMAGHYHEDGQVDFTKQYIGQHAVEYHGTASYDSHGGFKIAGRWSIGQLSDEFFLESVSSSAN